MIDMTQDLMAHLPYGAAALHKLAPVPEGFRLYAAEWLIDTHTANKPELWEVMKVTGAEFRAAKTGPNKGKLSVLVKGTKRDAYVTRREMDAFAASGNNSPA